MKIIGQSQHDTYIVEMSEDEWESFREGRTVMPFIGEQEFLHWAKEFKAELNRLDLSQYLRKTIGGWIETLWRHRDDPDSYYWQLVLADCNHLRSFAEWASFMATLPDAMRGYRWMSLRSKAYAELIAALESYLQTAKKD
jgi:hypothetical protein